jgi:hypothetical protein
MLMFSAVIMMMISLILIVTLIVRLSVLLGLVQSPDCHTVNCQSTFWKPELCEGAQG